MALSVKKIMSVALVSIVGVMVAEQGLVIKKSEKKVQQSAATLKNCCCDEFGELLKISSDLLGSLAQLQKLGLNQTYALLEDDKNCFFARADKQKLSDCLTHLRQLKEAMSSMQVALQKQISYLDTLSA